MIKPNYITNVLMASHHIEAHPHTYLIGIANLEQIQAVGIPLYDDILEVFPLNHFILIHISLKSC